jgi:hypothetical protein
MRPSAIGTGELLGYRVRLNAELGRKSAGQQVKLGQRLSLPPCAGVEQHEVRVCFLVDRIDSDETLPGVDCRGDCPLLPPDASASSDDDVNEARMLVQPAARPATLHSGRTVTTRHGRDRAAARQAAGSLLRRAISDAASKACVSTQMDSLSPSDRYSPSRSGMTTGIQNPASGVEGVAESCWRRRPGRGLARARRGSARGAAGGWARAPAA